MPTLKWKTEFNVNVRQIDEQHERLAGLVDRLGQAGLDRSDIGAVQRILTELIEFTREHFATEERLMLKHAYPGYSEHKAEHELLLDKLIVLQKEVAGGWRPSFHPERDVSTDWVMLHVNGPDRRLGVFLNGKGVY